MSLSFCVSVVYGAFYKVYSLAVPTSDQWFQRNLAFMVQDNELRWSYKGCYFKVTEPLYSKAKDSKSFSLELAVKPGIYLRQKNYRLITQKQKNTTVFGK